MEWMGNLGGGEVEQNSATRSVAGLLQVVGCMRWRIGSPQGGLQ